MNVGKGPWLVIVLGPEMLVYSRKITSWCNSFLFLNFHPEKLGKILTHFDDRICFLMGWLKPPTRSIDGLYYLQFEKYPWFREIPLLIVSGPTLLGLQ